MTRFTNNLRAEKEHQIARGQKRFPDFGTEPEDILKANLLHIYYENLMDISSKTSEKNQTLEKILKLLYGFSEKGESFSIQEFDALLHDKKVQKYLVSFADKLPPVLKGRVILHMLNALSSSWSAEKKAFLGRIVSRQNIMATYKNKWDESDEKISLIPGIEEHGEQLLKLIEQYGESALEDDTRVYQDIVGEIGLSLEMIQQNKDIKKSLEKSILTEWGEMPKESREILSFYQIAPAEYMKIGEGGDDLNQQIFVGALESTTKPYYDEAASIKENYKSYFKRMGGLATTCYYSTYRGFFKADTTKQAAKNFLVEFFKSPHARTDTDITQAEPEVSHAVRAVNAVADESELFNSRNIILQLRDGMHKKIAGLFDKEIGQYPAYVLHKVYYDKYKQEEYERKAVIYKHAAEYR